MLLLDLLDRIVLWRAKNDLIGKPAQLPDGQILIGTTRDKLPNKPCHGGNTSSNLVRTPTSTVFTGSATQIPGARGHNTPALLNGLAILGNYARVVNEDMPFPCGS